MIEYLIKVVFASSLFLGFYLLFLQREKMFRFNRIYLLLTLVLSLTIPLFLLHIPEKSIPHFLLGELKQKEILISGTDQKKMHEDAIEPVQISQSNGKEKLIQNKTEKKNISIIEQTKKTIVSPYYKVTFGNSYHWYLVILLVYFLITVILLGRFIFNLLTILVKITHCKKVNYNGVFLVVNTGSEELHSFWDYIFIPNESLKETFSRKELLEHEIAHSKQKHSGDILLIELIKTIFWFNPVFYLYKKAIQLNHEFLADEAVLKTEANVYEYQKLILNSMEVKQVVSIASNFNYVLTKKRLLMMTKKANLVRAFLLQIFSIPFILVLILVFSNKVFAQEKEGTGQLTEEQLNKLRMALKVEDISEYLKDSLANDNKDYIDTLIIGEKVYVVSTSKKKLEKLLGKDKNNYSIQAFDKGADRVFRKLGGEQLEKSFGIKELSPKEIDGLKESNKKPVKKSEENYHFSDYKIDIDKIEKQSNEVTEYFNSPEWKDKMDKIEANAQYYTYTISDNKVNINVSQGSEAKLINNGTNTIIIVNKGDKSINEDMEEFRDEMRKFRNDMKDAKREMKKINSK